jgi:predicted metal-dependent peptidase
VADKQPVFKTPDELIGHLTFQIAHSDSYLMGPMAQLNAARRYSERMDVAARLVSGRIEYNPELLQKMGVNDACVQIKGMVVHEALMHMDRKRQVTGGLSQYDSVADLAAELATWHKLEHGRWKVGEKFPHPKDFNLPDNLSMEEYFKLLMQQVDKKGVDLNEIQQQSQQQQQGQGQGQGQGQDGDQEQQQGGGQGDQDSPEQQLAKALGSNKEYHKQDHSQWHQIQRVEQEAMAAQVPDKLESWMRSRGIEPEGLKRLVEEIRQSKKEKWYNKLKELVGTRMATNKWRYSVKKPSRRHGVPNAGRTKVRKGILAVAVDTSGSIGNTELGIFISKLKQIAVAYEAPFEVIICDAAVHVVKMIKNRKDVESVDLKGGGGTSSLPVFNHLEKKYVDMLVYLTDLEIDFPEHPPRYKVLWGVINNPKIGPAPFGETHHLEVDPEPKAGR